MKRKLVLPGCLVDIRLPFPGAAAVLTAAVIMGARCSFALSAPVPVNTSQSQNRRWETVFTNEIPLRWDWNAAAASARLQGEVRELVRKKDAENKAEFAGRHREKGRDVIAVPLPLHVQARRGHCLYARRFLQRMDSSTTEE